MSEKRGTKILCWVLRSVDHNGKTIDLKYRELTRADILKAAQGLGNRVEIFSLEGTAEHTVVFKKVST